MCHHVGVLKAISHYIHIWCHAMCWGTIQKMNPYVCEGVTIRCVLQNIFSYDVNSNFHLYEHTISECWDCIATNSYMYKHLNMQLNTNSWTALKLGLPYTWLFLGLMRWPPAETVIGSGLAGSTLGKYAGMHTHLRRCEQVHMSYTPQYLHPQGACRKEQSGILVDWFTSQNDPLTHRSPCPHSHTVQKKKMHALTAQRKERDTGDLPISKNRKCDGGCSWRWIMPLPETEEVWPSQQWKSSHPCKCPCTVLRR